MTAPLRIPKHYRLPPVTVDQITEIATARDGLTDTQVVVVAVSELHRSVCRSEPAPVPSRLPTAGLAPRRRAGRKNVT